MVSTLLTRFAVPTTNNLGSTIQNKLDSIQSKSILSAPTVDSIHFSGRNKTSPAQALAQADYYLNWFNHVNSIEPTALKDKVFTVFDLETMGFDKKDPAVKIIEISAIKFKNGKEIDKYTTLVQPDGPIPDKVTEITHITQEMAESGIPQKQALKEFAEFVGEDTTMVAHNASFDIPFLRTKLRQEGLTDLVNNFQLENTLCTMTLARKALPDLKNYKAGTVGEHFGFKNENAHRAENDTRNTGKTLFELIKLIKKEDKSVTTDTSLFNYQGPTVPIFDEPVGSDMTSLFAKVIDTVKPFMTGK